MKNILSTQNLHLREINSADSFFVFELVNSPEWIKYIGERNVKNEADVQAFIQKLQQSYHDFGFGFYVVELKQDNTAIGICGLIKRDFFEHADIGFAFLSKYTGKGYAFEMADAFYNYTRTVLNINKILAIAVPYNVKSINLLNKIGLKFSKEINIPNGNELLHLFESE